MSAGIENYWKYFDFLLHWPGKKSLIVKNLALQNLIKTKHKRELTQMMYSSDRCFLRMKILFTTKLHYTSKRQLENASTSNTYCSCMMHTLRKLISYIQTFPYHYQSKKDPTENTCCYQNKLWQHIPYLNVYSWYCIITTTTA